MLEKIVLDPEKVRAARAVLNWTQKELSVRAGVSHGAVTRYELHGGAMMKNNLRAIQRVLEAAGIVFHRTGIEWFDGVVSPITYLREERDYAEEVRSDPRQAQGIRGLDEGG